MRRRAKQPATAAQLRVAVASFTTGESLDFSRELALTKAAVLYADTVTLIGPKVTLLSYLDRLRSGSRDERDRLFWRMLRELPEGITALQQLEELASAGPAQRRAVKLVKGRLLAQTRPRVEAALGPILAQTEYHQFDIAVKAGVVQIDPLTNDGRRPSTGSGSQQQPDAEPGQRGRFHAAISPSAMRNRPIAAALSQPNDRGRTAPCGSRPARRRAKDKRVAG